MASAFTDTNPTYTAHAADVVVLASRGPVLIVGMLPIPPQG